MRCAVTGVSGHLGGMVVDQLLKRVDPSDLIAVSRTPSAHQGLARRGVSVRYGDFTCPESLTAAFADADRILVVSMLGASDVSVGHAAAFAAAARAGVHRIVYTSVQNPSEDNPFPPAASHARSERALLASGVPYTILRNALYADLRVDIAAAYLRSRRWTTNMAKGAHAFVSRYDCARAAAAALLADDNGSHVYDITGPDLIDAEQYLAVLRRLGHVSRYDVDDDSYERYRSEFVADPLNSGFFELFTGTGRAIREGRMQVVGTGVADLTGHAPQSFTDLFPER